MSAQDERFLAIMQAARTHYPDGVVVLDGEHIYGLRKNRRGTLNCVHEALASILQESYPTVQADDLLAPPSAADTPTMAGGGSEL